MSLPSPSSPRHAEILFGWDVGLWALTCGTAQEGKWCWDKKSIREVWGRVLREQQAAGEQEIRPKSFLSKLVFYCSCLDSRWTEKSLFVLREREAQKEPLQQSERFG